MKKIISFAIVFVSLFAFSATLNAATITKTEFDGKIKIEGTGSGSVQIVLFDKDSNPIYMTTALVKDEKFAVTFPEIAGLEVGDYQVKVADYDGKNTSTEVVKVTKIENPVDNNDSNEETVMSNEENPKTGDNIFVYIAGVVGTIVVSFAAITIIKKSKKRD